MAIICPVLNPPILQSTTRDLLMSCGPKGPLLECSDIIFASHLDTINGSLVVNDAANSITGTATGDTVISSAEALFDGSSLYVPNSTAAAGKLDLSDIPFGSNRQFTVECWFFATHNVSSVVDAGGIIEIGGTSIRVFKSDVSVGQTPYIRVNAGSSTNTIVYPQSTWTHVAIVVDGVADRAKFYINGILRSDKSHTTNYNPLHVNFGAAAGRELGGHLDECIVTNGLRYTANFEPDLSGPYITNC